MNKFVNKAVLLFLEKDIELERNLHCRKEMGGGVSKKIQLNKTLILCIMKEKDYKKKNTWELFY